MLRKHQAKIKRTLHKAGYLTTLNPGCLLKEQETDASLRCCHLFVTFQVVADNSQRKINHE